MDNNQADRVTVSTPIAAMILKPIGIEEDLLRKLANMGVVKAPRDRNHSVHWRGEDLFKAFCFKVILDQYNKDRETAPEKNTLGDYLYIYALLRERGGGRIEEFVIRSDWEEIASKAWQEGGIDFDILNEGRYAPRIGKERV